MKLVAFSWSWCAGLSLFCCKNLCSCAICIFWHRKTCNYAGAMLTNKREDCWLTMGLLMQASRARDNQQRNKSSKQIYLQFGLAQRVLWLWHQQVAMQSAPKNQISGSEYQCWYHCPDESKKTWTGTYIFCFKQERDERLFACLNILTRCNMGV